LATWPELRSALESVLKVDRVDDDFLVADVLLSDGGRQQVGLRHEMVTQVAPGPEYWLVSIDAVVTRIGAVDLVRAIAMLGTLVVGCLGYVQGDGGNGLLTVGTKMPVDVVNLNELPSFCMQIGFIAEAAHVAASRLNESDSQGAGQGEEARISDQANASAWQVIREYVARAGDITIEKDFGDGFIFWVHGTIGRHRLLLSKDSRGPGLDYFIFESALGAPGEVDLRRAVEAADRSLGGVTCTEDYVAVRHSQHVVSLTPQTFQLGLADVLIATENYQRGGA